MCTRTPAKTRPKSHAWRCLYALLWLVGSALCLAACAPSPQDEAYVEGAWAAWEWDSEWDYIVEPCVDELSEDWADHYGRPADLMDDATLQGIVHTCGNRARDEIGDAPFHREVAQTVDKDGVIFGLSVLSVAFFLLWRGESNARR